jgi:hypothetical protein
MPTFNQHIAGNSQLHAGGGLQQSAIVANAKRDVVVWSHGSRGRFEIALNQVKFTHVFKIHSTLFSLNQRNLILFNFFGWP